MPTLDEAIEFGRGLQDFYHAAEGLQRGPNEFAIPEILNWTWHFFNGQDLEWVKQAIRDDVQHEWLDKHPGMSPQPSPRQPEPGPAGPAPSPVVVHPPSGAVRVLRVTDERDGEIINRQYSYWSAACIRGEAIYVFAGVRGKAPQFFKVSFTGDVERLGARVPYGGEAEGWSWNGDGSIVLIDGSRLIRFEPFTGDHRAVLDISGSHPGHDLWQSHSSDDGLTHSATVRRIVSDGPYPYVGTIAIRHSREFYDPAQGDLDESQIDATGQWLIIKEKVNGDERNRVIDLDTRDTRTISNAYGAVGHSDCGPGFVVGEDDQHGACVRWDLRKPLTPGNRLELFKTWGMGHVSVKGGRCLLSDATHLSLVALDGSGVTPLIEHGMIGNDYDHQVMASLDPSGRVACYISNKAGRNDVYLLVLG